MTDDLKAPERIWAWQEFAQGFPQGAGGWITHQTGGRTEYIRADRIATLEAALADMTQQRDAAIKNVRDVREEVVKQNMATDAQYAKTVENLQSERDAAMAGAVKVRELVWEDVDAICTRQKAPALGGHYSVVEFDANTEEAHFATNIDLGGLAFVFILEPDPLGGRRPKQYSTLEAAKAAAQADYNARILSALTPDPDRMLALTAAASEVLRRAASGKPTLNSASDYSRGWNDAKFAMSQGVPADALAALSRIEAQAEARGMRKERERIVQGLRDESVVLPCRDDAAVVASCARLVEADFSYDEADRLSDATEAAASEKDATHD